MRLLAPVPYCSRAETYCLITFIAFLLVKVNATKIERYISYSPVYIRT